MNPERSTDNKLSELPLLESLFNFPNPSREELEIKKKIAELNKRYNKKEEIRKVEYLIDQKLKHRDRFQSWYNNLTRTKKREYEKAVLNTFKVSKHDPYLNNLLQQLQQIHTKSIQKESLPGPSRLDTSQPMVMEVEEEFDDLLNSAIEELSQFKNINRGEEAYYNTGQNSGSSCSNRNLEHQEQQTTESQQIAKTQTKEQEQSCYSFH